MEREGECDLARNERFALTKPTLQQHKEEIAKHGTTLQSQLAQIAELKKDNAQKQAQLRTANQNLAQVVSHWLRGWVSCKMTDS